MTLDTALQQMDGWLARHRDENAGDISSADVLQWRAAHAAALKQLAELQDAGAAVVSAYLLRPAPSSVSSRPVTASAGGWRQHMKRLSAAMAELERRLAPVGPVAARPIDNRPAGEAT